MCTVEYIIQLTSCDDVGVGSAEMRGDDTLSLSDGGVRCVNTTDESSETANFDGGDNNDGESAGLGGDGDGMSSNTLDMET